MKTKKFVYILSFLVLANVLAWTAVYELSQPQLLEVVFFNVGQGDSIFIETSKEFQILIDGGPDSTVLERLEEEMPYWDRNIDLIILTHPEHDHMAGLIEVLKAYKVENILWTGIVRDGVEYGEWIECIENEGANIIIAESGKRIEADNISLNILYPFESLEGERSKSLNNTSIVARLTFDNTSFLFTGDAFKSIEKELINEDIIMRSDVLKVGHHGSKTSSADEFIREVMPQVAVIQAGADNHYGHPSPETLETLEKYDIKTLITDLNNVKIISDGTNLQIK